MRMWNFSLVPVLSKAGELKRLGLILGTSSAITLQNIQYISSGHIEEGQKGARFTEKNTRKNVSFTYIMPVNIVLISSPPKARNLLKIENSWLRGTHTHTHTLHAAAQRECWIKADEGWINSEHLCVSLFIMWAIVRCKRCMCVRECREPLSLTNLLCQTKKLFTHPPPTLHSTTRLEGPVSLSHI